MDVKRGFHFTQVIFDGRRKGTILSDFAAALVRTVKKDSVTGVMAAHELGKGSEIFQAIDFMGMIAHEAVGVEGVGLFLKFLFEEFEIGPFFEGKF